MAYKHKFSYEEKVKILSEYLNGIYGFREVCHRYNINQGSLKNWKRLYETFGWSGLKTESKASHYSHKVKESAVQDYLCHALTVPEILKKYRIRSETQLKRWIKKYNGHEELKASSTGGNRIMTKGRKTTYEERIEIVEHCIAHNDNYAETAEKYKVSYQQVYTWMRKYADKGIEGLIDRRGRTKPKEEMSELEQLRLEQRMLQAKIKRQEMEIALLKKLEELERGWD